MSIKNCKICNTEELIEFYQYCLYKKLIRMQQTERAAYMMEFFGKRWVEVYGHLENLYPQLSYVA